MIGSFVSMGMGSLLRSRLSGCHTTLRKTAAKETGLCGAVYSFNIPRYLALNRWNKVASKGEQQQGQVQNSWSNFVVIVSWSSRSVRLTSRRGFKIPWLNKLIWVIGVLRTVVCDWRFDNLCASHLQSQVIVFVSWKFKSPGKRFDWSIVAFGKREWLAVKTCAEIGHALTNFPNT